MSNKKGFTLIELLVVIAIIGLLSTLAVVALNSARAKSRDSKRVADVKQVQTALELFYADSNGYPCSTGTFPSCTASTTVTLGDATASKALCSGGWKAACAGNETTYMGLVPAAPNPADGTCATATPANAYIYTWTATGYTVTFCTGGAVGDLTAGGHTADANGIR